MIQMTTRTVMCVPCGLLIKIDDPFDQHQWSVHHVQETQHTVRESKIEVLSDARVRSSARSVIPIITNTSTKILWWTEGWEVVSERQI